MATEAAVNAQMSHSDPQEAHFYCSFCGKCQHQVRQLIADPNNAFICDGCILLCVDIIEGMAEDSGRAAFRHCLVYADEPRYYDLKQQAQEQRMLLEAAEPVIPEQYTALRETIAGLLRPSPSEPPPPSAPG